MYINASRVGKHVLEPGFWAWGAADMLTTGQQPPYRYRRLVSEKMLTYNVRCVSARNQRLLSRAKSHCMCLFTPFALQLRLLIFMGLFGPRHKFRQGYQQFALGRSGGGYSTYTNVNRKPRLRRVRHSLSVHSRLGAGPCCTSARHGLV